MLIASSLLSPWPEDKRAALHSSLMSGFISTDGLARLQCRKGIGKTAVTDQHRITLRIIAAFSAWGPILTRRGSVVGLISEIPWQQLLIGILPKWIILVPVSLASCHLLTQRNKTPIDSSLQDTARIFQVIAAPTSTETGDFWAITLALPLFVTNCKYPRPVSYLCIQFCTVAYLISARSRAITLQQPHAIDWYQKRAQYTLLITHEESSSAMINVLSNCPLSLSLIRNR